MNRNDIPIASPCGEDWTTMRGTNTRRFCDSCKKHVHDLSAMTEAEAAELMATRATEGLCVRYLYDADGRIAFAPKVVPVSMLSRAKRHAVAALAVAAPLSLTACMGARMEPRVAMGEMPAPPPVPSASASAAPSAPTFAKPPVGEDSDDTDIEADVEDDARPVKNPPRK
jgi:hypothetical protein